MFFANPTAGGNHGSGMLLDKVTGFLPMVNFSAATNIDNQLMGAFSNIPPMFVAIFMSATLLLLLDQLFLRRKKIG